MISVETSSALPHAPVGGGPILRVGDRGSVFDPALTAFCEQVAAGLAKRGEGFIFQRKLMDGGMCEALAFLTYGYRATGICLALGNYHNMNVATGRIDSEYISLADWQRMVVLFEALALDSDGPPTTDIRHRQSLADRFARYRTLL